MGKPPAGTNTGSLLRLFQSEFFDVHLHMHYLLSMENGGVQDYLVNALYKMGDDDVDFYLPQLCQLALLRFHKSALHRFLLDKASKSMHFALKITWLMQSYADDRRPEIRDPALTMVEWCEEAIVSSAVEVEQDGMQSSSVSPVWSQGTGHQLNKRSSGPNTLSAAVSEGDLHEVTPPSKAAVLDSPLAATTPPRGPRRPMRRARSCPQLSVRVDTSEEGFPEKPLARLVSMTPTGRQSGAKASLQRRMQLEGRAENEEWPAMASLSAETAPAGEGGGGGSSSSARGPPEMSRGKVLRQFVALSESLSPEQWAQAFKLLPSLPNAYTELGAPVVGWMAESATEASLDCHMVEMGQFMSKQLRRDFFGTQNRLVSMITKMTSALVATPEKEERKARLQATLLLLNRWLLDRRVLTALAGEGLLGLMGLHLPCLRGRDYRQQIVHINTDQCRVFSSATRAPFLLVYETANLDEVTAPTSSAEEVQGTPRAEDQAEAESAAKSVTFSPLSRSDADLEAESRPPLSKCATFSGTASEGLLGAGAAVPRARPPVLATVVSRTAAAAEAGARPVDGAANAEANGESPTESLVQCLAEQLGAAEEEESPLEPTQQALWRRLTAATSEEWLAMPAPSPAEQVSTTSGPIRCKRCAAAAAAQQEADDTAAVERHACKHCEVKEQALQVRQAVWGESWQSRKERIHRASPFGRYPSWALNAVVVKGGDDLRQELLASQVIKQFSAIFKEAKLPLWLREMEVLVTSGSAGCIEFLHDSMSVTGIKKLYPDKTLAEIFSIAFKDQLFKAKRNFIESYAAYSLVVWFLQVKDRHNDNLMMDSSGHVVHLDFGFMLSNSPGGNMGFEQSPFKLTQEFLDVMGGEFSDEYEYFRTLVIRGFLEARKHVDRIVLPVRLLLSSGSKLPCFRDGLEWVMSTLQERFYMNLTEEACIDKVLDLIDTSVNNWSTIQYDMYQKFMNGIV